MASVTVKNTDKKYTTNPEVKCNNCGKEFSGGVSRIGEHITTKCKGSGDAFEALKTKVLKETEARTDCKKRKAAEAIHGLRDSNASDEDDLKQ